MTRVSNAVASGRSDQFWVEMAEQAAKAALDGRVEEARQAFAKAIEGSTNSRVHFLAYEFCDRTGDIAIAQQMLARWLAISGGGAKSAEVAAAYFNLGRIYRTRGDLDEAEKMFSAALSIFERLGQQEARAILYGHLGLIY